MRSTRYVSCFRCGEVAVEDAADEGEGVGGVCEVDVASVVRKRVEATEEGRKSSRLGAAVAVRIGI